MAIGILLAALVGVVVALDAQQRYGHGARWGIGVFLLLILVLPMYLIHRSRTAPTRGVQSEPGYHPGALISAAPPISLDGRFWWDGGRWVAFVGSDRAQPQP